MRRKLLHCYSTLQDMMAQEAGQDLVEYAMVFAVIALAASAGMQSVAGSVNTVFTTIGTAFQNAVS
jgi:pilus assembly protein Flp/PilA